MIARLTDVNRVYELAGQARIHRYRIAYQPLRDYARSLRRLMRAVGDQYDSLAWREFVRRARGYYHRCLASPLPFHHEALGGRATLAALQEAFESPEIRYSTPADMALEVIQHLEDLVARRDNPLLEKIREIAEREQGDIALVTSETKMQDSIAEELRRYPQTSEIRVVSPERLRDPTAFDVLCVLGTASWYELREQDYIFTAPRAREIHLLRYTFQRDSWEEDRSFTRLSRGSREKPQLLPDEPQEEYVEIEPELPSRRVVEIARRSGTDERYEQEVPAFAVYLEGERATLLEDDDNARVFIIDPREEGDERVQRIPSTSVEPGTFLLLRIDSKERDYILPVANELLGSDAEVLRQAQRRWKEKLRERIKVYGHTWVAERIKESGCEISTPTNVRNWASERFIRHNDKQHFVSVMRYLGFGPEADELWEMMTRIRHAHQEAGHKLRKMLLQHVASMDLSALLDKGYMEFNLPEYQDFRMGAFRVIEVDRRSEEVPEAQIGRLIDLE